MDKDGIYRLLEERGISFRKMDHRPVYNMHDIAELTFPDPEAEAKNLFVRDDKKQAYYLITVKGDKRVDLKKLREQCQTRRLSFASDEDLLAMMGLEPGSVTPLGLMNDERRLVVLLLDRAFFEAPDLIAVHPNDNAATVWLKPSDLVELLEEHGSTVSVIDIPETES